MAKKRRDDNGRVLHTGETLRKTGPRYCYTYTDINGKRRSVYAHTLELLREKEDYLVLLKRRAPNYVEGRITVIELLTRYIALKQGMRHNTKVGYDFVLGIVKKDPFGSRHICDIRTSDAKLWLMKLQQEGKGYSTITSIRGVVKPAFQMAYEDDIIMKNPFDFVLSGVVRNDSQHRKALTPEQMNTWMSFIRFDPTYRKYYDEFVILLETGMRVSEFCGLTLNDLDFKEQRICVDHQLLRDRDGTYHVERTKTESGCRYIPMTPNVVTSLKRLIEQRKNPKKEWVIDGYSKFLLLDKNEKPKVALHIENEMRWARKKYKKLYPDNPLPHITPHVMRHTFCTNWAHAGMDVKSLQYLMGHSDASVTMNVYSHATYDHAADTMQRLTDRKFSPAGGYK